MFENLFKRPAGKSAELPATPVPAADVPSQRAQQADVVAGLAGDEAAAVEFILQSPFSELRLAAAEFVHSPAQLERVHAAVRNTDRRVAKLMQGRLDAIRHHAAELDRARACLAQGAGLLQDALLTPNHVADLDRKWSVIAAPELADEFNAMRAQLAQRLEAQVALQRAMIDSVATLRRLIDAPPPAADLAERLTQMAADHASALASAESASLPRSLTSEFATLHARLTASLAGLEQAQSASDTRDAALSEWEGAAAGTLSADALQTAWHKLAGSASDAQQQRYDALLAALPSPAAKPAPKVKQPRPAAVPDQHFIDTLDAMEAALQQGSLAAAADFDKALKESKGTRLTPALSERLAHTRAELKRLSDWARWGGNVSREELIKAVEQLPSQKLAMSELAKKVGSMRERWKGLDTLSGAAPKSLWERFDAACTTAYAPAAAHFKHLADERHTNAAKAQALVADAVAEAERRAAAGDINDWKQLAATVQRLRLAWTHLGAIDRKDKRRLDAEFHAALDKLQGPLEGQRKTEMGTREELIAQVTALNPQDRHTLDTLRSLQEKWQEHARALPLERKAEQALWQRFRAACDAVFAKRKESAHAADVERRAHEDAKEALCARLEALAAEGVPDVARVLREAATEWHAIGPVPRAHEAKIEKRYHAATAALQHAADAVKRNAAIAQASALRDKLRLCQALEADVAAGLDINADDWRARWAALPALATDYQRVLQTRLDAALNASADDRGAFVRQLEANRATLLGEILRLEIALGVDSGSEFARERLKLQVEVLQSSLKSGQKPASQAAQFLQLCAMPALVDARTASRIEHLFTRIGRTAA